MLEATLATLYVLLSPGLATTRVVDEPQPSLTGTLVDTATSTAATSTAARVREECSQLLLLSARARATLELDGYEAPSSDEARAEDGRGDEARAAEDERAEEEDAVVETSTASATRPKIDLDDAELKRLWASDRAALGSIAFGFPDAGRLVNAVPFPVDKRWTIVDPPHTYATEETVDYLVAALTEVAERFPDTAPMRVNHISAREGGHLRPHQTHQMGRDVDLAFYYRPNASTRMAAREKAVDPARNWALVRALATKTDVELILVDRRIQKVLYDYALSIGEDRTWLDSLFNAGRRSLVHHARRHRDHFHIRFFSPRAQELGRRLTPLLGDDEGQPQLVRHVIKKGDSLGKIAKQYGVSTAALKRANNLTTNLLRAGRVIVVPARKVTCGRCASVPEVVIPPRHLPPEVKTASAP